MALLASQIDRTTLTLAGGTSGGVMFQTVNTSLPTQPDWASVNPVSIQALTAPPQFGYLRGASNFNTLASWCGTIAGASSPIWQVEATSVYVWGPAR